MPVPHEALVTTASSVAWTGGQAFDGFVLFILATPALGSGSYPQAALRGEVPKVRLPHHTMIPIKAGVVSSVAKLTRTDYIQPPNSKYCWWVYGVNDELIDQGGSLVAVAAATVELTMPTLTAPTAAAACPTPEAATSGQITNTISTSAPTLEDIAGTKNGSNTAFTITESGTLVQVYWNGQLLDEGVEYSRSGVNITMISPAIPLSGDSLQAVIFA